MIRFVHFFNYAAGVSVKDGEAWYLREHVPQVKKLPGIRRYLSWQGLEVPDNVRVGLPTPPDQFVRRSEVWFDNLEACRQAVTGNLALWTPSKEGTPGLREIECMFLDKEMQYDLMRDTPPQQYKYMTLPMMWPQGRPEVEVTDETIIYTYFVFYRPDISVADGEDWYLGHHTREGKQLAGMKHYRTWKSIRVPEKAGTPLQPNKWFRLTELGVESFDAFGKSMSYPETKIQFTPSPLGRVFGGWAGIFINLDLVEDLLA